MQTGAPKLNISSTNFTCRVIPMKFTFTENSWHMSNLLQQLNACVSSQLFLLLPESFWSCFFLLFLEIETLRKVRPSWTETCQSRPCVRQIWQYFLTGFCLQKFIGDYAKAVQQFLVFTSNLLCSSFFPVIVAGHLPHYSSVTPASN